MYLPFLYYFILICLSNFVVWYARWRYTCTRAQTDPKAGSGSGFVDLLIICSQTILKVTLYLLYIPIMLLWYNKTLIFSTSNHKTTKDTFCPFVSVYKRTKGLSVCLSDGQPGSLSVSITRSGRVSTTVGDHVGILCVVFLLLFATFSQILHLTSFCANYLE